MNRHLALVGALLFAWLSVSPARTAVPRGWFHSKPQQRQLGVSINLLAPDTGILPRARSTLSMP
jgi:hypothetical protein